MALVKTSKIASKKGAKTLAPRAEVASQSVGAARRRSASANPDTLSERLAAASEEVAGGLSQASSAANELRGSMEQIASGAEEAAGASQEQLAAVKRVFSALRTASSEAESSRRRTESAQALLMNSVGQITNSARAIERNAKRQEASIEIIVELERRARDIGEITQTVSRISDQTNLLALNAAIEAARAGDHGRGFAVVADEVRSLAGTSDMSAQEVKGFVEGIQTDIRGVVASIKGTAGTSASEATAAVAVVDTLEARQEDIRRLAEGSQDILTTALKAERAASEAQRGTEQVASAAEEQSAGAAEVQSAVQQQAKSLDQSQTAVRGLVALAEKLRDGKADASAAEQIGATAEELSATIQELTSVASHIMAAVAQISRGSQQQAAATHQTSTALTQIEKSAKLAQQNASQAGEQINKIEHALAESRMSVQKLMTGVGEALRETRVSVTTMGKLEAAGRRIEKIVDAIALVAVQTSMLSVSGAVEAARAGEAGRGFAVVSNDIRSLAREAAGNVDRAKDTVRSILEQIAMLKRDLEQSIATAEIEIQNNRATSASLDKVAVDLAAVSAGNGVILDGADAILASASECAAGARQIATAAEEASNAARQAATAAAEQAQNAENLAAAIEEIASLADALKQQNG
jgi:methyl-accepting chemotaxis protein